MKEWFNYINRYKKRPLKRKILFINQPLFKDGKEEVDTFDYFCQLFASLNIHLDSLKKFDVVTKVVSFDKAIEEQNLLIKYCVENPYEYDYLIVNLFSRKESIDNIKELMNTEGAPKLILIDKGFRDEACCKDDEIWKMKKTGNQMFKNSFDSFDKVMPSYFQVSWEKGGEMAALQIFDYAKHCFKKYDYNEYDIIVLHGNDCFERGLKFKQKIETLNSGFEKKLTVQELESDFSNNGGYDEINNYLNTKHNGDRPLIGVFCSNDEMALGVRRAFIDFELDSKLPVRPKIVGFDGIKDVTLHIDHQMEKYILNTVNVKVNEMTKNVYLFLNRYNTNPKADWVENYIEADCKLYKPIHQQRNRYDK